MLLCCCPNRNGVPGPFPYPLVGNAGFLSKDHPGEYLQQWAEKNGNPSVLRLDMGPVLYPLVGNAGFLSKDHPGEYLQQWAEKNGNPSVLRLDMGDIPCVVVMDIEAFHDHLRWEFCGRMENVTPLKMWFHTPNDMTSASGVPWYTMRTLMNKAMDSHEKSAMRPKIFETEVRALMSTLEATNGEGIHTVEHIRPHVLNLVNMLSSNTRDELKSDAQTLSLKSFTIFSDSFFNAPPGDYVKLLKFIPASLDELKATIKPYKAHYTAKFEQLLKRFSARTEGVQDGQHPGVPFVGNGDDGKAGTTEEAIERIAQASKPESLIEWMLVHRKADPKAFAGIEDSRINLSTFIIEWMLVHRKADPKAFAGVEDSRINLSTFADLHAGSLNVFSHQIDMTLVHLANNPKWQELILCEIREQYEDGFVPLEAKFKLTTTMAFIYEIFRHRMQAHLSLNRRVTDDTTLGGYPVDKGTLLLCNLHAIHHDKRYWTEPEKFDPTRFLEGGEGLKNMREGRYVPFNAPRGPGTRGCAAKNFVLGALFVIVANVVKNFKIESKDGEPLYDNYVNFFTAYGESMVFKPREAGPDTSGMTIGEKTAKWRAARLAAEKLSTYSGGDGSARKRAQPVRKPAERNTSKMIAMLLVLVLPVVVAAGYILATGQ